MEDYEARRLADAMEGLSARMQNSNLIKEMEEASQYTRRLSSAIKDHSEKMDEHIKSNEILVIEQQINRATEQLISIKIAHKSGVMDAQEAVEMLKFSYDAVVNCFKRISREIQPRYTKQINNIYAKYGDFIASLEKNKKTEEDFNF